LENSPSETTLGRPTESTPPCCSGFWGLSTSDRYWRKIIASQAEPFEALESVTTFLKSARTTLNRLHKSLCLLNNTIASTEVQPYSGVSRKLDIVDVTAVLPVIDA
jgi:hypothetical protein